MDPHRIDEVVLGNVNGAGEDNRNVARMAGLLAGLPQEVPGTTVNRLCGSGGEAIVQAARIVRSGDCSLVLAGGVEGMSRAPFVLPRPTSPFPAELEVYPTTVGWRMANPRFPDACVAPLGVCTERLADEYGIDREAQDCWALRSHQRADAAWRDGRHGRVLTVAGVSRDESLRPDTTLAKLSALRSAFTPAGSVTAGNSSPVNDGAAAVFIGYDQALEHLGVQPLARIAGSAVVGVQPDRFAVAPVSAMRKLAEVLNIEIGDIEWLELNEAFAAMVLCCLKDLPEIDIDIVTPDGGAIALGHPLGASMVRVVLDLCDGLVSNRQTLGVAAACIGVGQGMAIAFQAP
jgi:acetyl-CoA acyltransferase